MSTWRERAAEVIEQVFAQHAGKPDTEIRRALREAYPFGRREAYPYRIWCEEVRRLLKPHEPHRGKLRRKLVIDWNCRECGKVATLKVPQHVTTVQLMAAIRTAHADASPDCTCHTPRWSYAGFYRRTNLA